METIEKNLILNYDELRILLYSQGFRTCEGVRMPEKAFTAEDVLQAMHHLVSAGLLRLRRAAEMDTHALAERVLEDGRIPEDTFAIRPDLLQMVRLIGDPAGSFVLRKDGHLKWFCYVGDDVVVVSERLIRDRDCVRLRSFSREGFNRWREEVEADDHDHDRSADSWRLL